MTEEAHATNVTPLDDYEEEIRFGEEHLSIWDGFRWQTVKSSRHRQLLESKLETYLQNQLEQIEFDMALDMSLARMEKFGAYYKAITDISDRYRDHDEKFRRQSTRKILMGVFNFMEDSDEFSGMVEASNRSPEDKEWLLSTSRELTMKNAKAVKEIFDAEIESYKSLAKKIFVKMKDEINEYGETIDIKPDYQPLNRRRRRRKLA